MDNLIFSQNSQKIANVRAISPRERCSVNFGRKSCLNPLETSLIKKKKRRFQVQNLKNTKSRKMPSKWLWEPLIKSYEKILNFINRKFIDGKVISPLQKHSEFSKRNVIKNSVFNSNNMRNTYSLFSIMITSNKSLF